MFKFCRVLTYIIWTICLVTATQHWACATMYKARIEVMVDATETVVFKFASDFSSEVPVNSFSVVGQTNGEYDYQKPAWYLSIPPGSYKRISRIRYGEDVDGFSRSKVQPLIEGRPYLAELNGAGISESIEFELVRCSGKTVIRILPQASRRSSSRRPRPACPTTSVP